MENIYKVERILKKRKRKGQNEYFVKWHGYDESHNSWEPSKNILDKNLIKNYNKGEVLRKTVPESDTSSVTSDPFSGSDLVDPDYEPEGDISEHSNGDGTSKLNEPSSGHVSDVLKNFNNNENRIQKINSPSLVREAKKYFCIFCKRLFSKLPLHLESQHSEQPEVKRLKLLPKGGCPERKEAISDLRKKGSFEYNAKTVSFNQPLIVERRTCGLKSINDYSVCPHCKGTFVKNSIRKHYARCIPNYKKGDRSISTKSKALIHRLHPKACTVLKTFIFPKLRDDDITQIIRYDELVIQFGNSLCAKYRLQHLYKMIRAKLRLLGRFMLEMRKLDSNIRDLASLLSPEYFDTVMIAVNHMAGFDSNTYTYRTPATAADIGTTLKKCAKLFITICIKNKDSEKKLDAEDFLKVFEEDFGTYVNKTVTETQLLMKRQKKVTLPSTECIGKFFKYIEHKRRVCYNLLREKFQIDLWKELASYTLISILIFNRKRAGEAERITLNDFNTIQSLENHSDMNLLDSVPAEFQEKAKKYSRFVIRGKKARGVPVLISKEIFESIKLIVKFRQEANVAEENPYLFALPSNSPIHAHLDACKLLRLFAEQSGVSNPELIRGTYLRKHIATQSALMDLREEEVSDLANFMGHADKIHKDHYRIPVVSREIGRISGLLEIGLGNKDNKKESCFQKDESSIQQIDSSINQNESSSQQKENCTHQRESGCELSFNSCSNNSSVDDDNTRQDSWNEQAGRKSTEYGRSRCVYQSLFLVSPRITTVSRRSWSTPERSAVRNIFSSNISTKRLPKTSECLSAIKNNDVLKKRSPAQVKAWVSNEFKKNKETRVTKRGRYNVSIEHFLCF
nr:unnamed protein product [Callosobruchus analis]